MTHHQQQQHVYQQNLQESYLQRQSLNLSQNNRNNNNSNDHLPSNKTPNSLIEDIQNNNNSNTATNHNSPGLNCTNNNNTTVNNNNNNSNVNNNNNSPKYVIQQTNIGNKLLDSQKYQKYYSKRKLLAQYEQEMRNEKRSRTSSLSSPAKEDTNRNYKTSLENDSSTTDTVIKMEPDVQFGAADDEESNDEPLSLIHSSQDKNKHQSEGLNKSDNLQGGTPIKSSWARAEYKFKTNKSRPFKKNDYEIN